MQSDSVDIGAKVHAAVKVHEAGDIDRAEALYREILDLDPNKDHVLNLMGVIAIQRQNYPEAERYLRQAIGLKSSVPTYHVHLAEVLRVTDRPGQALAAYQEAIRLGADRKQNMASLGRLLTSLGRHAEAAEAYESALEDGADDEDLLLKLGLSHFYNGEKERAIDVFKRLVVLNPEKPQYFFNLGVIQESQGNREGSIESYRRALALRPDYVEPMNNLATILQDQEEYEEARTLIERAIALQPEEAQLYNNLGNIYYECGDPARAEDLHRQAIELAPELAGAHASVGTSLIAQGKVYEAMRHFRLGVQFGPDDADAHSNLGLALLLLGQFQEGAEHNEWRWNAKRFGTPKRPFTQPLWRGQDLTGKTLLVWGEQGVGDETMMMSQLPKLQARGARLLVEADHRLVALFQRSFPDVTVFPRQGREPPVDALIRQRIDYQTPAVSMVRYLGDAPEDLQVERPHLVADSEKAAACRARYDALGPGLKVGISWFSINKRRAQRIAALEHWAPILTQPGINVIDLQYGNRKDDREAAEEAFGIRIHHDDRIDSWKSLDDFAAQVAAMDLVISISNTTVHIAGGLGIETWTMLPMMPDWRWFLDREFSPFYPTMRLFRQRHHDDWPEVIERVGAVLREKLAAQSGQ